jgi:hypothetical protein
MNVQHHARSIRVHPRLPISKTVSTDDHQPSPRSEGESARVSTEVLACPLRDSVNYDLRVPH